MALLIRDQKHQYLRYEGLQYTNANIVDFKMRLARIYRRQVHRVQVFYFEGLPDLMAEGLRAEEIKTVSFGLYWGESVRQIPDKGDLSTYWIEISLAGDFLGTTPSYTLIKDPMLRLCDRLIACSIAGRS
ncbi:hypothetical protein Tco_0056954, partial [Tanacetum coccineum]